LLFAPFYIEINSNDDLYRLRFHRLASAVILIKDYSLTINLQIAWWKKQIDPFVKNPSKDAVRKPAAKRKSRYPHVSFKTLKAIVRSFKINHLYINIDTGNVKWNGILYPAFYGLSQYVNKTILINFTGKTELELEIKNNIARMAWAYIYSSLKLKTWKI
jgi:hypothetical protein